MKVGIIGASFAKAAFLPALRNVPEAEVVAIASARMESARAAASQFGVPDAYDDWEEMLGAHDLDWYVLRHQPFFMRRRRLQHSSVGHTSSAISRLRWMHWKPLKCWRQQSPQGVSI